MGISPRRYVMLRRLKQVRRALRDADPMQENVADCARRYGFTELGRLAGVYRTTCGETPSATAPRPGNPIPEPVNSSNLHSGTKILRSRLANGFGSSLGVHHLGKFSSDCRSSRHSKGFAAHHADVGALPS